MKNFLQHLLEVQKTYEFRIKIANIDPTDTMDRLEAALDAYGVQSISKPKRLPIADNVIDFPSFGPTEVYIIDVSLTYPVNDAQLLQLVSERWGVNSANIVVVPRNHPEELWRNKEGELREFKKGEAVLTDDKMEDSADGKSLGKTYSEAGCLLRELNKATWEVAGKEKTDGKTTNDLPQNNQSPIKGQK